MPFVPFENGSGPRFVPFDAQYPEATKSDQKKKRSWSDAARDTSLNFTGGAVSGLLQMAGNAAEKAYQQTTKSAGELVGDAALSGLVAINPAAAAMVERVLPSKADRIPATPQEVRNARDAAVAHDQSTLGTLSNIWRDKGREIGQAFKSAQSQEGREMDAGLSEASGDGATSALSYLKDNPGALLNMMANSAGYSLPIMAASAIGKQGAAMASNVGMSGLAGGSAAADETRQRLLDMPESKWQQSPQYAQLRKAGMDHAEAAAFLADRAASQAFNQAAVVSAGAGAITAPLEVRALRGGLSSKAGAINEAKALAQTVGKESAEEYLQEGVGEQLAQEMAMRDAGVNRSLGDVMQSVNTAGVLGAVAGAAQGGGVHVVGRAVNIADGNPNVGSEPNPAQDVQPPQKTRIMLGPDGRAVAVPVEPIQQQPAADSMPDEVVSPEQEANAGASAILDQLEQAEADSTQQPVAPIDRASAPNVSPEAPNLSDAAPNVSDQGAVSAPALAQDEAQPAQPQVQPASPAVDPYAMPLQQFVASQKDQSSQTDMPHDDQVATLKHADAIESALAEGRPVPPAALAGHAQTASRYAEYFPRLSLAVQEHAAKVAGIDAQIQKLTAKAATRSAPVQASIGRDIAKLQAQKSELTGQPVAEAPAVAAAAQQPATAQRAADLQPQQAPSQQVVSNNPAAEPAQTKGRLTPLQDGRIAKHAQELQALAGESGWAEQGGKVIRDQSGNVTGRTKWIPNADWWAGLDAGSRLDQAASIKAVQKAVAGEPLTAKEKRAIAAMLDVADMNERRYAGEPDIDSTPAMVDDESIAERQAIQAEAESAAQAVTGSELDQLSDAIFNGEEGTLTDDEIRRWLGEDAEAAAGRSAAEARPGYQAGDNYSGSSEARPAGSQRPGVGGTAARGDAQGNQGNEQEAAVTDDFALQSQTEQGLRQRDEALRNAAAAEDTARKQAEQKAQADAERDSFALTGSDRAADIGAAHGQGGLFDAPVKANNPDQKMIAKSDGAGFATRDALRAAATRNGIPQSSLIEKRDGAGNWIGLRHEPDNVIDRIITDESRAGKVIGTSVRDLHSDDVYTLLMAASSKKQINAIADYIGKYAPRAAAEAVKTHIDSALKQKGWATEESLYGGGLFDAPTQEPAKPSRITEESVGNMRAGDVVRDGKGDKYLALGARHKWLEVAPIVNGKAQISADTTFKFHLDPETAGAYPERRSDPVYATGDNLNERTDSETESSSAQNTADNNDNWLNELFGIDGTEPAQQSVQRYTGRPKEVDFSLLVPKIRAFVSERIAEADDWAGRKYKHNKKQIHLDGDGPAKHESISISSANESRRRSTIDNLTHQANAAKSLIDRIERGENISHELAQAIEASDADIETIGKPRFGKTRNDQAEAYISNMLLGDRGYRYGKGTLAHLLLAEYENFASTLAASSAQKSANPPENTAETQQYRAERGLYSFAGTSAATADTYALSTAQQRIVAGEDVETVRRETGWFKGVDGQWRFEISDADARLNLGYKGLSIGRVRNGVPEQGNGWMRLGDVLNHPALFAAYPALADMGVKLMPEGRMGGANASYSHNGISLNEEMNGREALSSLLHEIQHGIQAVEGFATGGSPDREADINADPSRLQAIKDAIILRVASGDGTVNDRGRDVFKRTLGREPVRFAESLANNNSADELRNQRNRAEAGGKYEQYHRLAGEVEARNVQARAGMTAEQRRDTPPSQTADVADQDVILVFNGKEMAHAPSIANGPNTAATLRATLAADELGSVVTSLIKAGRIVLHDTQASFNPDLKFKVNGVTTADGKVHLIAENLTRKNAMAVLLHELFHLNGKNLIDTPNWTRLMQSLEQAMVMAKNTKGRLGDFYREAERRLEIAKRAGPVGIQAEEFGAYMIEHFEQAPASLRKLAEKIVGEVKAWLLRSFGMQAGRVTPGQLRAIARAALVDAAEHAGGDVRVVNGRLAYSRDGADRFSTDQKTLNVNGVDRPVLNADGKPIHNTQQGIINFWKWYDELQQRRVVRQDARGQGREGNREATGRTSLSSHFFDEQGRPKIFYHGTGAEISEFDLDHPDKWDHGWLGKGVYLASDHELARFYSDQKHGNPNIMPLYAGVSNPYEFTFAWKQKLRNATPQEIAAVTDALMANGYDGGVLKFGDGSLEVVAFDNRAIKSAIGNTGAFDPANPDIRFSITDDATQKAKDQIDKLRSPGTLDSIIYTMQDKLIDLRRMTEHMQKAGTLSERINAYLAEELYHGRVAKRHGDFIKKELRPLMAGVRAAGFTPQAFEEYLHARHAPERNAEMAKRNPSMQEVSAGIDAATKRVKDLEVQLSRASARGMATSAVEKALNEARGELSDWLNAQPFQGTEDERLSLSGMSDEQARQVMAKYTPKQLASLEALGRQVDAINESTLKTLETYGLESKEMLDKWRSAYAHYVPLHRDEAHPDSAYHPIGQGFSIKGGASKRATGSNEKVTNILGHLAQQREAALTRGEKNLVAQTLFMQIKALDDAGFAEVNAPKMRTFVDERTGFTRRELDNNYRNANNVMMLKVAGRDAAIMFNERNPQAMRMAGALKNMDATDMGWFASRMAPITRWFASVNTQFNPIFGMVNLLRDSSAGSLNLSSTPLNGKQKEVMAEAANILRQSLRNGLRLPKQGKVAALWEDFQNTGGQTGYRELYRDAADRAKDIQKEFDALDRGSFSQKLHNMADWLSDFNESMENTIRLAAYKVALDNGMSKKEAASLAKNLTVNFNRKGKIGRDAGALYAFFNASVQGTTRMLQTLRGPAGKRIVQGGLAMGAMQALIGAAMMGGGDDEDDEWAKIPEFVKERNLIIPISGKDYVTIPLPLGFHVIPNAGRLAMETLMGRKSVGDATGAMLWSAVESFNPIGTSSFMQTLTPTAFDPAMALAENKDWTGSSIYRENMSQLDPEPGHRLAKASASAFGHGVSRAVNWMTGGNEYRPGMVSWTPDQIDYVIGQITGGVGREMLKATQVVSAPITGDELPAHKVPLLGRFYGNTRGVMANTDQFYTNLRDINIAENELKGRMKDGDYDGASSVRESDPLAGLVGDGNAAENMVRKLKQQRRDIQKRADDGWRDEVKAVDERIADVMKGLNRQVREAKDKK